MSERSLPDDQHMARVRLQDDRWREFRALAMLKGRSGADYLGGLVQKELNRAERTEERREARRNRPWVVPESARDLTGRYPEA